MQTCFEHKPLPVRRMPFRAMAVLLCLAACATPAPRPEPTAPAPPSPVAEAAPPEDEAVAEEVAVEIRVAMLLPLSGTEGETGQALLDAATMALMDAYDPRIRLLPFDTAGTPDGAEAAARMAVEKGVHIFVGPLLADNVAAAGDVAAAAGLMTLGFSNDARVAAPRRYILGFLPENEVRRVVEHASDSGYNRFGGLFSEGRYGDRVRTAFGDAVAVVGRVTALERYPPDADALAGPIQRLGDYERRRDALRLEVRTLRDLGDDMTDEIADSLEAREVLGPPPFEAVLVPEGGALLRTIAPLLPFYEIDPAEVKLMGTGLWDDPDLRGEPPLQGAWYAAPLPGPRAAWAQRFETAFGDRPPRIATLSYDAVALLAAMIRDLPPTLPAGTDPAFMESLIGQALSPERLTDERGFSGLDGLFRLLPDGTNERALAVLEIVRDGVRVAAPPIEAFPRFGERLSPLPDRSEAGFKRSTASQGD
ncbi:amino acid/amide ABC transporter substrate-binding protein (HAAT family) [Eilatimonas milleporae]|uniref:Amino acid/amide ABC transporter substrate-binding protein (HAAT family) n=2 Tax=Eilatimonas milleporae TaxID=911205 RepID=A0A3M0BZP3_9PROT|nr:amino acid/amide ABC transporter substrate-binding protein (HAAT family) [Eilatimonas milleporae]